MDEGNSRWLEMSARTGKIQFSLWEELPEHRTPGDFCKVSS